MSQTPLPSDRRPPRKPGGLSVIIAIALALLLLYWLRLVLLPFVFAGAFAYMAAPAVGWVKRGLHLKRRVAALLIFFLFLGALTGLGFWGHAVLLPQAVDLARHAPSLLQQLLKQVFGSTHLRFLGHNFDAQSLIQSAIGDLRSHLGAAALIGGALAGISMAFLTLVLFFFFMVSGPRLARGVLWLFPPSIRPTVHDIARQLNPVLLRYVCGVIFIVAATSLLTWIGIGLLLGLPHAVILSLLVGILEAIPVVGPITSIVLLSMVAVTQGSWGIIVGVALFAMSIRLFIDQLMAPIVLGKAVRLHPAVIIFALLTGGLLFGILGLLVAVPAAATIKIVLQNIYSDEG